MIDPFKETMLPLAKAARKIPGRTVSSQTVYRWCSTGIDGIKLETIVIGGRMQTSQESLTRFFAAVTDGKQSVQQAESDGRSDTTSRKLAEAGLL